MVGFPFFLVEVVDVVLGVDVVLEVETTTEVVGLGSVHGQNCGQENPLSPAFDEKPGNEKPNALFTSVCAEQYPNSG